MFSNHLIVQILEYLDHNIYKKVSMNELSQLFHYDKAYMMRLFKKEAHMTIIEYMNRKRIYLSLQEFSMDHSILEIGLNHGFYSLEYFSEMFHTIMGVSPSTYQLFIKRSNKISNDEIYTIQENITLLSSQMNEIEKYKQNVKPKSTIKVLSIFKEKTHL